MSSQPKRGRGRPPGSKNKPRRPAHRLTVGSIPKVAAAAIANSVTPETTEEERPVGSTETLAASSAASGEAASEERAVERFDAIASTVPEAVGAGEVADESEPEEGAGFTVEKGEPPPTIEKDADGKPILTEAVVGYYLRFGFKTLAVALKEKQWELNAEELEMATPVTHDLVAKWLPSLLGTTPYKEEIAFAIVMGGIALPRLHLLRPKKQAGTRTSDSSASPASVSPTL